ncbi:MAG: NTP transferase domain-containing protein [Sumerlaeia bacterium]
MTQIPPSNRKLAVVILAAGKGSRMKTELPKVLHQVGGRAMIDCVLDAVEPLGPQGAFVVVGHRADDVEAHIGARATCVLQEKQLGTGHAVMMAAGPLRDLVAANPDGVDVLVLNGDGPLLRTETLSALVERRREMTCACAVLTTHLQDPTGYGRIQRDEYGAVRGIVEHKDATEAQRAIKEINTGIYAFDAQALLTALDHLDNDNVQGEYYLTDTVKVLRRDHRGVEASVCPDPSEVVGVNSRQELANAEAILRRRVLNALMDSGVTVIDPETTYVDRTAVIGRETILQPFTIIRGQSVVGEGCIIGPHATLIDATLEHCVRVRHAVVEGAAVEAGAIVGPFEHLKGELAGAAAQAADSTP